MKKRPKKRLILGIAAALLLGCFAGFSGGLYLNLISDLPQVQTLATHAPPGLTRVYSADGVLLARWYVERRDPVPLSRVPAMLLDALLATEDRTFYKHMGVDVKGLARALYTDLRAGSFVQGGSTITQQLAKTLFLTPEKSLTRKLREALLALQIEKRYTKDEILELYLNEIYLGSGAYGVQEAARTYFGKNVWDLDLPECALIAGLPKKPSGYSPLVSKEAAKKRRDTVLRQMLAVGDITPEQCEKAIQTPIALAARPEKSGIAPYFVEEVRKELEAEEALSDQQLYRSGLTVVTTLDTRLQAMAEQAVKENMEAMAERVKKTGKPVDSLNASLLCMEVATGRVLAMVGGTDFTKSFFNRAVMARRQPGSSFKPLVYGTAVEKGYTESSRLLDAPVSFPGGQPGSQWSPQNYSKRFQGEISMRRALAISQNIPAVRLADQVGIDKVISFARKLGIESPLPPYLSLALGSSECTLLELVAAYAVFPNNGVYVTPYMIQEIRDKHDRVIFRPEVERRPAMSEEGASIMVDMLRAVVTEGTARSAGNVPGLIAGKTGTTSDYKDAWFLGFSPKLSVGVWVGNDNAASMPRGETGGRAALPIFADFMTRVFQEQEPGHWRVPAGMMRVRVSAVSGRALAENEPGGVYALYRKGQQPTPPGSRNSGAAPEETGIPPVPGEGIGD